MIRFKNKTLTWRVAAAVVLMATTASAAFVNPIAIARNLAVLLPGVDQNGNLDDFVLSGPGEGIAVLNRPLGIIVQASRGDVTNLTNRFKVAVNTGSDVQNPDTGDIRTATSDVYVVGPRGAARMVSVYNPLIRR